MYEVMAGIFPFHGMLPEKIIWQICAGHRQNLHSVKCSTAIKVKAIPSRCFMFLKSATMALLTLFYMKIHENDLFGQKKKKRFKLLPVPRCGQSVESFDQKMSNRQSNLSLSSLNRFHFIKIY